MTCKGRILVIDDSQMMLDDIKAGLTEAGYDVLATSQTVGIARHLKGCDLVILDYHMPGIDGLDVLRSLRAAAETSCINPRFYLYTSAERDVPDGAVDRFDGALKHKGNTVSLVQQVDAVFRLAKLKGLTGA